MTTCSVVMVSYHTGAILFASIGSVLRQKQLAELVVVDNGNPPDVVARLQQMALIDPRFKVITGQGNVGYAKGCNLGSKKATGYYVLFLNPDCLLPPDALTDTMLVFENFPRAVLAGACILAADGSLQPESFRPLWNPMNALGSILSLKPHTQSFNSNEPQVVPAISGAYICIRRKDFDRLNGMDEAFFVRGAGMDLCMRVHKAGGEMVYVPRVSVTRLHTNDESSPRPVEWYRTRGLIQYLSKHFDGRYVFGFMPIVKLLLLLAHALRVLFTWIRRAIRPAYVMSHTIPAKRLMVLASGVAELEQKQDLSGKTVLVTGATSQVGLCVIRRLIASGAAVLAISRNDPIPFEHDHLRWIKGDLTDQSLHLQGYLLDVVVHCAPLWHLPSTIDLLADAEVKRIVAIGSTSVFGKLLSRNTYEKNLVEKLSRAETDIAESCQALGVSWTILRPTMIYGVGLDLGVTSLTKLINFLGFMPVYPPAFGRRQPVHADDLAAAVILSIANPATYGKSYNISGGEVLTYRQMLERLFAVCGKKTRIMQTTLLPFLLDVAGRFSGKVHINGEIARRMNDDLMFFHDDAKRDFGFTPRPFLSGGMKDIEGY